MLIVEIEYSNFLDERRTAQRSDPVIASAITQIKDVENIVHGRFKKFGGMKIKDGILYRSKRIIVPGYMTGEVIATMLDNSENI